MRSSSIIKKKTKPDIVVITWGDAWGEASWKRLSTAAEEHEALEVTSTGFVIKADKIGVSVCTGFDENGNPAGQFFVPHGMIRKIKKARY